MLYCYPLNHRSHLGYAYRTERDGSGDECPGPDQTSTPKSQKIINTPAHPFIFSLPPEMFIKIFKDPVLFEDDLATLRLVCKQFSLYATEVFSKGRFSGGPRFEVSRFEFARLAAICSSQLRPFLDFIHFDGSDNKYYSSQQSAALTHTANRQIAQIDATAHVDYSSIRKIKFETEPFCAEAQSLLHMAEDFTNTFVQVLRQTVHLEVFSLSTVDVRRSILWHQQHKTNEQYKPHCEFWTHQSTDKMLSSIKSDSLSELGLADTVLSHETLLIFLERHRGTMRKLSLRACALAWDNWLDVLQWISHNLPHLESLDLQHLQYAKRYTFWGYGYSTAMFKDLLTISRKGKIDAYIATLKKSDFA